MKIVERKRIKQKERGQIKRGQFPVPDNRAIARIATREDPIASSLPGNFYDYGPTMNLACSRSSFVLALLLFATHVLCFFAVRPSGEKTREKEPKVVAERRQEKTGRVVNLVESMFILLACEPPLQASVKIDAHARNHDCARVKSAYARSSDTTV